jgi:hypothetical protein
MQRVCSRRSWQETQEVLPLAWYAGEKERGSGRFGWGLKTKLIKGRSTVRKHIDFSRDGK